MRREEREHYRERIAQEIEAWQGRADPGDPWWPLIRRAPEWFDALVALACDSALDARGRCIVHRVLKYLISPLDLRPELIYGVEGFREDVALVAAAVRVLGAEGAGEALTRCGLNPGAAHWAAVERLAESDLDEDLRQHLRLLLAADTVAGDYDQAWSGPADEERLAPAAQPTVAEHVMVFAGPGTGKTYRLEQELWRLLSEEHVQPEEVLVTTFTNKAADELRVRAHDRLRAHDPGSADGIMQRLAISTIHGFCLRLISRFHHRALFLKGTFSPMDPEQRMLFLFRHGRALNVFPLHREWKEQQRCASEWASTDLFHFYAYVGQVYDFLSEDALRSAEPQLRDRYLQIVHDGGAHGVDERIIATYPRYWQLMQEEGFLDHSMLLAYTEALLDDPQVRRQVQGSRRHVLVDEYQDTNPIQDRIFRAMVGGRGRLFAVGDDDQSIYAFRGADVRNATQFPQRWPGARVEKLEENRRSTGTLVAAATSLISHNTVRESKSLFTRNETGTQPWLLEGPQDELPSRLAALLLEMRRAGVIEHWREIAVLFRGIGKSVSDYVSALRAAGIPARIAGDRRFLKAPVMHALLAIFGMLAAEVLSLTARKRVHRPWFEALGITDTNAMAERIASWHRRLHAGEHQSLIDLFYSVLRDSGALDSEPLLPDLGRLSTFIAEAESQLTSPDITKRLSWFNSYAAAAADSYEGPREEPADEVVVMTIHKSKGLEFRVVVIADVTEGVLPAQFRESLRTRLRRELTGLEPQLDPLEEERRILYVGMTRAREYLILTAAQDQRSPFLDEFVHIPAPAAPALPKVRAAAYGRSEYRSPPMHVHHSAVYNYHFCPRRYLLESRYGFAGRPIAPLRAGQSLHRSLEIYHRLLCEGEQVSSERRERIFEQAWLRPRSERAAKQERATLFGAFATYADWWEAESREHRLRTVDVERPFFVAEGHGVLTGRIDLVRERDERLEIVEFKFHENRMLPEYPRRQLEHYSLAYPGEQPRLMVHYLREGREEEVSCRHPGEVREELGDVFEKIAASRFEAQPKPTSCRLCPVRFACSAGTVAAAA